MPVAAPVTDTETSPWPRLRQRFALPGCDYNQAVLHWAHWYTENPSGFSTSLAQSMPFLIIVLKQIEHRDLPGEFAFLPFVESNYTPITSRGDHAAGIWQLMPDTAREAGLKITHDYDGRLDIVASTDAALRLLEHYQREFDDWRLADMAYNVGEYRVGALIGKTPKKRSAEEMNRLRVNSGTHAHLAKLLALACIVADPQRFDVKLPQPKPDDDLVSMDFPAPVNLELAARIAGIDPSALRQLNPGYVHAQMPERGPFHLLLPAAQRDALAAALAKLPQTAWRDWHEVRLHQAEPVNVLAAISDIDAPALAAVNRIDPDATLAAGTQVLLPGIGRNDVPSHGKLDIAAATDNLSSTHIVRSGDTLWSIARNAQVRLTDLLRWNHLDCNATLHLGQQLQLHDEFAHATASAAAAGAAAAAN